MTRPLVSVIVPVYNHARYVEAALLSITRQTYRPIELIVIDDGSRDESADVAASLLRYEMPDAVVLRRENRGAHNTINQGLRMSRGEYLTILNGLLAGEQVKFAGELYRVAAQVTVTEATAPPILVAALGPAMLKLCGRLADGTITWMGGVPYLRDVAIPTMTEAALAAGRPRPRFVAMVPVAVTDDIAAAKAAANRTYAMYGQIPSYRATLDRGGAQDPADVAIIGTEEEVETGLRAYAAAGVTDLSAVISPAVGNAEATFEMVGALAKRGL